MASAVARAKRRLRRKRKPRFTGAGADDLPHELLFEIFARLPNLTDHFRCALVCKRWLRLFADPALLRRLWPAHRVSTSSFLLGLFYQQGSFSQDNKEWMKRRRREHSSVCPPTFLPVPALGGPKIQRDLTAFVADEDGLFNHATPLASRRGHLLLRLAPHNVETSGALNVAVVNPITGARHVVPPLECGCFRQQFVSGHAIVTAGDTDGGLNEPESSLFAELFLIGDNHYLYDDNRYYHLHRYSASTQTWSPPTMCLRIHHYSLAGARHAVVRGSQAHWLYTVGGYGDVYLLSAEVGTARVDVSKLPVTSCGVPWLCVLRDGGLSVACVCRSSVELWSQPDGEWLCARRIAVPAAACPDVLRRDFFSFNGGAMLALYRRKRDGLFVLNLETQVMEKVMDCPRYQLTKGFHGDRRAPRYVI